MNLINEYFEPVVRPFTRVQWAVAGLIVGVFLGFVDTLFLAALMGYAGITVPAWFGVPTTFTGYFVSGIILGRLAPKNIAWEPCAGIFVCVILMMAGLVGFRGHGFLLFLFHFVVLPGAAAMVSYLGILVGREGFKPVVQRIKTWIGRSKKVPGK
jgi:hypothetical protein